MQHQHTEREVATAFLASVSHELRTPLNAILGMLELSLDEPLVPTVREYLLTACDSARSLATNLNLMLDLAQIDSHPLRISATPIAVGRLAEEAIAGLSDATRNRITTNIDDSVPSLYGDEAHLQQVLGALLVHSARWLEHSEIVLAISGHAKSEAEFLLEIGICERGCDASRDESLVPFDPVENAKYASTNLSLAVARRWLDRMGGRLRTDPMVSGGRFFVTIPLRRIAPPSDDNGSVQDGRGDARQNKFAAADTTHVEPLDVLVVDDTEANQKVVKAVLAKRGHRVQLAENGQQALEQIRRGRFDVVLMDAQMPIMNGFEATAAIRCLPEPSRSRIPIIAMTAHALHEDQLKCFAAGMDDYLAKPIDVATLVNHVEYYGHTAPDPTAAVSSRGAVSQDFLAGARARLAGDEQLLLELIRLFRQDSQALLEKISTGLENKDCEMVSRAAHNLRGLAANFDDTRTIHAAGSVEKSAEVGDLDNCNDHLATLRVECNRLVGALNEYESHANH